MQLKYLTGEQFHIIAFYMNSSKLLFLLVCVLHSVREITARRSRRDLHGGFGLAALEHDFGVPPFAPFGGPLARPFPFSHQFGASFDSPFGFSFPYQHAPYPAPFPLSYYPPPPPFFGPSPPPPYAHPYYYPPPLPPALPPLPPPLPPGPPPAPIIVPAKTAATLSVASIIHALIARKFYPPVIPYPVPRPIPFPVPIKVPVPIAIDRPVPVKAATPIPYDQNIHEADNPHGDVIHISAYATKPVHFKSVSPFLEEGATTLRGAAHFSDERPAFLHEGAHFVDRGTTEAERLHFEKAFSSLKRNPLSYELANRPYEEENYKHEYQGASFKEEVRPFNDIYKLKEKWHSTQKH